MSDDEYERIARELQAIPYAKGPKRAPPPWEALVETSKAYWLAKAHAGERPQAVAEAALAEGAVAPAR